MNAHSSNFALALPHMGSGLPSASLFSAGERWSALHEAARIVAMLAGEAPDEMAEDPATAIGRFPARIEHSEPWRRAMAENGIADLAAIMEPGLAALLALTARGGDGSAAAAALWREFCSARAALLQLLPPETPIGADGRAGFG